MIQASKGIFEVVMVQNDRKGFELTLQAWLSKLKKNRVEAVKLVGEEIVAKYERYLSISMIGFNTSKINLTRVVLKRLDHPQY